MSEELLKNIQRQIREKSAGHAAKPRISAFDADGTLWKEDANDILLSYEEKYRLRKVRYLMGKEFCPDGARRKRCEGFAVAQAGFTPREFRRHCLKALKETPLTPFPFQRELLNFLKSQNHLIYVVTSSIKQLVETACRLHSLPVDRVLGAETALSGGKITDQILEPFPFGDGKERALLKATGGCPPVFASGNTKNDIHLLKMAVVRLVVQSAKKEDENFESEQKMAQFARENGWLVWTPQIA